ncbi:MAG: BON domain-containing protein [Candidatus Eremiobacteraeota bacterium]|nr:BON domain-containing protein [Candidatus Eremiobacteraeota bacterium]
MRKWPAVLVGMLLLGACTAQQQSQANSTLNNFASAAPEAARKTLKDPRLRNAFLATRVGSAIAAQTGVNAARVKPTARDGVVTLTGSAPTSAVKQTMVQAARGVPGVRTVVDKIEVHP